MHASTSTKEAHRLQKVSEVGFVLFGALWWIFNATWAPASLRVSPLMSLGQYFLDIYGLWRCNTVCVLALGTQKSFGRGLFAAPWVLMMPSVRRLLRSRVGDIKYSGVSRSWSCKIDTFFMGDSIENVYNCHTILSILAYVHTEIHSERYHTFNEVLHKRRLL